ncbi:MAG TPA: MFS transporter [Roseiflexaceae bacterium]|nr:MFS transporter [Roseiflexaceae bacterium]
MEATTVNVQPSNVELTHGQLALVTIARLALTTAFRIIYPLQPFLAQQLEVDLRTISMLVTVQLLASLASPLGGMLADTRGERATMAGGLGVFCAGALVCALAGDFWGFLAGYALVGLSMALYLPAAQAYLSHRSPYARRAWTLGVFEVSWAGAALLGVAPLMQVVQAAHNAAPVFWTLLACGVGSLALVRLALPPTLGRAQRGGAGIDWGALRNRSVLALLAFWFLVMLGYDIFGVVQGPWLKQDYGADEARLGLLFGLAGAAELAGSLTVALLVDRIGKRRAVAGGFILTALCLAALPLASGSWALLVPLYFAFYLAIEFAIVAAIPLTSGVAPAARGTLMALSVAVNGVGRVLGSLISEPLWSAAGMGANALAGAAAIGVAVLLLVLVREAERSHVEHLKV